MVNVIYFAFAWFQFPNIMIGNTDLLHLIVSSIDGIQVSLHLFNDNTLDLCVCLVQLKQALKIEGNILVCIYKKNNEDKLLKYHFLYENL